MLFSLLKSTSPPNEHSRAPNKEASAAEHSSSLAKGTDISEAIVQVSTGGSSFTAPASGLDSSSIVKDFSVAAFMEVAKEFKDSTIAVEESASKDWK
jgi:hypothetical protein